MKIIAFLVIIFAIAYTNVIYADVSVRGYYRKDGRYVEPHHRSNPDGNSYNNWSTIGNVNPYTGKPGTKQPGYNMGESFSFSPNWPGIDHYNSYIGSTELKTPEYNSGASSFPSPSLFNEINSMKNPLFYPSFTQPEIVIKKPYMEPHSKLFQYAKATYSVKVRLLSKNFYLIDGLSENLYINTMNCNVLKAHSAIIFLYYNNSFIIGDMVFDFGKTCHIIGFYK